MNDFRQQAEHELAIQEARRGPVTNRDRYLDAIVRRLEREESERPAAKTPKIDRRPDCATCQGNGWVEAPPEGSYEFVRRCPDCDHGRVNLRSAAEPTSSPEVARAHLEEIRAGLRRLVARQDVRHL